MIPSYYNESLCGTMFRPNTEMATNAGKQFAMRMGIPDVRPATGPLWTLVIIDMQVDFVNPPESNFPGSLAVPGAVADVDRLCRFIYNNVARISHIIASLDTHMLYQPFHQFNWIAGPNPAEGYQSGDNPTPFTTITLRDLDSGTWQPTAASLLSNIRLRETLKRLEKDAKKELCIWPLHCEHGTPGHALDPCLMEAIHFHAGARSKQYDIIVKGLSHSSEHYGITEAEVTFDDDPAGARNKELISKLLMADRVYFAGEARSHCVLETLNQVEKAHLKQGLATKLMVLEDCMSDVPDICSEDGNVLVPFGQIATNRFAELARCGFDFVKSTSPTN